MKIEGGNGISVALGHTRLSIQDLNEHANQPMKSHDLRYTIIYNGEIYNAPTLRKQLQVKGYQFKTTSDTEVLLYAYQEWEEYSVERLTGMFAFAIWDGIQNRLFVARDRLGIKPVCYAINNSGIAIASETKCLRLLGHGNGLCIDAISLYSVLGYVPPDRSIWKGIYRLEPGQTMTWYADGKFNLRKYWSPPEDLDYEESQITDEKILSEVVEDHLLSDVPVGLFLSSGIDSSVIAALAKDHDIRALTLGLPNGGEHDETHESSVTAKKLLLNHTIFNLSGNLTEFYKTAINCLDEPQAYTAIVTQTAISKIAHEAGYKVVLSGDGGDEVFGGYKWYDHSISQLKYIFENDRKHQKLPAIMRLNRAKNTHKETIEFISQHEMAPHFLAMFRGLTPVQSECIFHDISAARTNELFKEIIHKNDAPRLPEKRRRQRLDLLLFCQGSILPKVDLCGMNFGLEVRPPFLDHRLVEYYMSKPICKKFDGAPKNLLRSILSDAGLDHVNTRQKSGFSLKTRDRISRKEMRKTIGQRSEISGINKKWKDHLKTRIGNRLELDTLFNYATWLDQSIDLNRR
jgi:asparagine synthase (glutamine-hydrolysing)